MSYQEGTCISDLRFSSPLHPPAILSFFGVAFPSSGSCLKQFAGWLVGRAEDELQEVTRKEAELSVRPDAVTASFMAAASMSGKRHSLMTDYILRILGLEVLPSFPAATSRPQQRFLALAFNVRKCTARRLHAVLKFLVQLDLQYSFPIRSLIFFSNSIVNIHFQFDLLCSFSNLQSHEHGRHILCSSHYL